MKKHRQETKKYVVAIDPSLNNLGVAIFENKKLAEYCLIKSTSKERVENEFVRARVVVEKIREIYHKCGGIDECQLVTEVPQHFGTSGYLARESGSIFKLTFLCGMLYNIDKTVIGYQPRQWKGQLPKDVVARRLQQIYPKEKIVKKIAGKTVFVMDHNIVDAIGIAHFHLHGKV